MTEYKVYDKKIKSKLLPLSDLLYVAILLTMCYISISSSNLYYQSYLNIELSYNYFKILQCIFLIVLYSLITIPLKVFGVTRHMKKNEYLENTRRFQKAIYNGKHIIIKNNNWVMVNKKLLYIPDGIININTKTIDFRNVS